VAENAKAKQWTALRFLEDRGAWHVCWTDPREPGGSRKCSTGTADRKEAEAFLAEWLVTHGQRVGTGPRDPSQVLVTAILQNYLLEMAPAAQGRIAYAVLALTDFFGENTVVDITPQACRCYAQTRRRSMGTVRRELGALRAAINHAFKNGRLTRTVAVELPERPPARERWLTRQEAGMLLRAARTPQARLYLPLIYPDRHLHPAGAKRRSFHFVGRKWI
jgi:hypothetical protein